MGFGGFGDWLETQRKAFERGELTPEQYARKLEEKAQRVPEQETKDYLKARARFIRDNARNNR